MTVSDQFLSVVAVQRKAINSFIYANFVLFLFFCIEMASFFLFGILSNAKNVTPKMSLQCLEDMRGCVDINIDELACMIVFCHGDRKRNATIDTIKH